jgi:hypothetical protein
MSAPNSLGHLPTRSNPKTIQTLGISRLQWVVGAFIATVKPVDFDAVCQLGLYWVLLNQSAPPNEHTSVSSEYVAAV